MSEINALLIIGKNTKIQLPSISFCFKLGHNLFIKAIDAYMQSLPVLFAQLR